MNNETCIHDGIAPVDLLDGLHHSQAGSGRHRCPTCAYEEGFLLGSSERWKSYKEYSEAIDNGESCQIGNIAPTSILRNLGDNQGGTGRHKCTNCAFKKGFEAGGSETVDLELDNNEIKLELVPKPTNLQLKTLAPEKNGTRTDFIKREIRNKHLGSLGELFILKNEVKILKDAGREDLANKVIHVSKEQGDGIGYDILSYDLDGNEKKIEVKTTRDKETRPFYITRNELDSSVKYENSYYLYRLFDFDTNKNVGKYYEIKGNLKKSLFLEEILYYAIPLNSDIL